MKYHELSSPALGQRAPHTPVVIPIAALEQHGDHMPLFTDSLLVAEVARRAEESLGDRVLFGPVMWFGNSEHHMDFPGTLSAAPRTYLNMLNDMVENLLTHGFRRIVLLNGHGGNIVPSQQAMFEVRQRHRERDDLLLLSTTYWTLGANVGDSHEWQQRQMGHAGEWETSMMLRIRPDLVGDHLACTTVPFGDFFPGSHRAWITKERTARGHIGSPQAATAEKGETLFATLSGDVIRLLEKVADWDGTAWE
ncbi:MAG: creatininase family protein, partial [Planctomycetales bacterium]|nr:creatininase family protein [Planctomycetales bacterium]